MTHGTLRATIAALDDWTEAAAALRAALVGIEAGTVSLRVVDDTLRLLELVVRFSRASSATTDAFTRFATEAQLALGNLGKEN